MARYNTVSSTNSIAGGNTITTPYSGLLTTLTGSGTVTIPNPTLYTGQTQTYYNSTVSALSLSTPSGVINGPGLGVGVTSLSLPAGSIITLVSDGTNYLTQDWLGGNVSATTLSASAAVNLSPASAAVTINPGTTSNMDNMIIGATTPASGKFSTLTATSANVNVTLSPTGSGTVTINPATVGNIDNTAIGQTTTAAGSFSTLKVATNTSGLSTPAYIFKNANSITNGGQESNAAALFGMANAGGDISVFVGSDQTNKHGYIGAVNRGIGYVPFLINPAGGNVGIGTGITLPSYGLHVIASTGNPAGFISSVSGGGNIFLNCTNVATSVAGYVGPNAWINNVFGMGSSTNHPVVLTVNGSIKTYLDASGHFYPSGDNTQNLGSASNRWANVYTGDLHLSNKGSSNSIDGTSGDWTIQEGEENLYIINNKTGKKYQFILKEI
jgi:hypothetical protein